MLFLFCVVVWFILLGVSCFKVFPLSLSSCFVSHFSIVIISLGEEGAGLCASRAFVCFFCMYSMFFFVFFFFLFFFVGFCFFVVVFFCHFSLPLGVGS